MVSSTHSSQRRQVLSGLMKFLVFIGLIFVAVPFVASISGNKDSSGEEHWAFVVEISGLEPGKLTTLQHAGKVVWVYTRYDKDMEKLALTQGQLVDPRSENSEQPANVLPAFRSVDKRFFIFVPRENLRNCQVRLLEQSEQAKFKEPCYGAEFDAAGRRYKHTGKKGQKNLSVPWHKVEQGKLKIALGTVTK